MRVFLLINLIVLSVTILSCSEEKESKPTISQTEVENVYNSCGSKYTCIYKECAKEFPKKESFENCVNETLKYSKTKKSDLKTAIKPSPKAAKKPTRKSPSDILNDQLESNKHLQPARKEFIDDMLAEDIIYKIEMPGKFPHVWIYKKFYSMTYDNKKLFGQIIWTYYITKDRNAKLLIFKDAYSGKRFGSYSEYGLDLD